MTRADEWKREQHLRYISCPRCGDRLYHPFPALGAPAFHMHGGSEGCGGRFVVVADPIEGTEVRMLNSDERADDVIADMLQEHRSLHRLLSAVYVLKTTGTGATA